MSDSVNDYGLGAPNTQDGAPEASEETYRDPLAHGLGDRDAPGSEHDGVEDFPEGGRQNKLEHGLAGAGHRDDSLTSQSGQPDPLSHALGSPEEREHGTN